MARNEQTLPGGVRLNDHLGSGVLAEVVPMPLVREVVARHGKQTLRNRKLPREMLVYYVIAMALFSNINIRSVLQALLESLSGLFPSLCRWAACESAISQGRTRLGEHVIRELAERVCRPAAEADSRGAWYGSFRLMAIDGSSFTLPDEREIVKEFPKHSNGKDYPNPQLRFVALVEIGTRCMCAVAQGTDKDSEKSLAEKVLARLMPDMLLLGDRYYMGYDLFTKTSATGAQVLFRAKANLGLKPLEYLPDGSYLAKIYRDRKDRRQDGGLGVRVIEYRVNENGKPRGESCRLVTSILDWQKAPAEELAMLYCRRWGIDTAFDELKSHLKLPGHTLRSKRPDLVRQEFWGFVIAHYVVRFIMHRAARANDIDPDDLSFQQTVNILRRKAASAVLSPPRGQ